MVDSQVSRIRFDEKRRTTLPSAVVEAAGLVPGVELVVRADGLGRVVIESPEVILMRAQDAVRAGKAAVAAAVGDPSLARAALAEERLAERAADTSLATADEDGAEHAP